MNKKIVIIVVSWFLVLLTMIIVASFSLQNGEKSSETSNSVVEVIIPNYNELTPNQQETASFSIRKIAHFSIYFLLGFVVINAFTYTFNLSKYYMLFLSLFASFLYASFDEFVFQGMTEGRAPQITDVLIDTLGALFGITLYIVIKALYEIIKNRRKLVK